MYGKHFSSTYTGSMYGAGACVFAVWGYVIANAVEGQVEINPKMLGPMIGVAESEIDKAIDYLCSPDDRSRSRDHEGRRLIREGQFSYQVTGHKKYRGIRCEEDRRDYNRQKQAEHREKKRKSIRVNNGVNDSQMSTDESNMSAHTEADTDTDTDTDTEGKKKPAAPAGVQASVRDPVGDTELGNPPSGAAPPKSEMRFFSDGWGSAYKERFGGAYDFKKEDGVAAARLLKLGTAQEMLGLARQAWEQTDAKQFWACVNQSATVAKFGGALSAIRVELSRLKPKSGKGQKAVILTPLQVRLGELFGRKAADRWSAEEIGSSENAFELEPDDWDKLEGYFSCKYADVEEYRVKNLLGLLNNFQRELDKARSVANRKPY